MSYRQRDWCEAEAFGVVDHWSTFQCERRLYEQDGLILQVGDDFYFFWLEASRSNQAGGDELQKWLSWAAVPKERDVSFGKSNDRERMKSRKKE